MPTILELLPLTNLGYHGGQPAPFDLGPASTLHYHSSLDNNPAFGTYKDPYLRGLQPTKLGPGTLNPVKYLDHPPK